MIYIYIYIFKTRTSVYLFKHFNFISSYDGIFSNFNYYKCLYNNVFKHLKKMHKRILTYAPKHK